jgi:hypothetical protein
MIPIDPIEIALLNLNRDSFFKSMSTVYSHVDPTGEPLVIRDKTFYLMPIVPMQIVMAPWDTIEEFETKCRSIEAEFMKGLMVCKERVVRTLGWTYLFLKIDQTRSLRALQCKVTALGIDSLKNPTVYTQHVT